MSTRKGKAPAEKNAMGYVRNVPHLKGYAVPYVEEVENVNIKVGIYKGEHYQTLQAAKHAFMEDRERVEKDVVGFASPVLRSLHGHDSTYYGHYKHNRIKEIKRICPITSLLLDRLPDDSFCQRDRIVEDAPTASNGSFYMWDEMISILNRRVSFLLYKDLSRENGKKAMLHVLRPAMKKLYNAVLDDIDSKLEKGNSLSEDPPYLPELFFEHVINDDFFHSVRRAAQEPIIFSTFEDLIVPKSINEIMKKHSVKLDDILPKVDRRVRGRPQRLQWVVKDVYRVHNTLTGKYIDHSERRSADLHAERIYAGHRKRFSFLARSMGAQGMMELNDYPEGKFLFENFDIESLSSTFDGFQRSIEHDEQWERFRDARITLMNPFRRDPLSKWQMTEEVLREYTDAVYHMVTDDNNSGIGIELLAGLVDVDLICEEATEKLEEEIREGDLLEEESIQKGAIQHLTTNRK